MRGDRGLRPDLTTRDEDYGAGKRAGEMNDWAGAARLFRRAEMRYPDHADLQNMLGFSYRNVKQYEFAFKHYRHAINLDPRHRGAHECIGEAYLLLRGTWRARRSTPLCQREFACCLARS